MAYHKLKIDHVTIAGSALETLRQCFAQVGLRTEYGGPHSNQITHMDLLGFDDGSYIELISRMDPGRESPWWHQHIIHDGGPCAWAVQVDDIEREVERSVALGIAVRGPEYYHRQRPDGILVQWDLAFLGDYQPGAKLPFLISDRTPRSFRVQPSASVRGSDLSGLEKVILGVQNLDVGVDLFRRVYDWPAPEVEEQVEFGARLAAFAGEAVILAQPMDDNWLQSRLSRFGESPCGFLIRSRNLKETVQKRGLLKGPDWFQQEVAWFERERLRGTRLGVTGQ
jgi:hypothetical protein